MAERGRARIIKRQQRIDRRAAVLDETAVRVRVDAQRRAGDDDLRDALGIGGAPRGEAAVAVLHGRERVDPARHGRRDGRLPAVRRQRLQHHGRHVRVGRRTAHRPAAAGELRRQNGVHTLAAHRAAGQVIATVEREQRKYRAVDALIAHPGKVGIRRGEVAAANLRRVAPDGGQRKDDARIVRGFVGVERAVPAGRRRQLRRFGRNVGIIVRKIVAVHGKIHAARKAEHRPLIAVTRRRDGRRLLRQRGREHRLHIRALCRRGRQHHAREQQRQTQRQKPLIDSHNLPPEGAANARGKPVREFSEITQHYTSRPAQKQRSATFPAPVMHGLSVRFSGRPPLRNFPRAAC